MAEALVAEKVVRCVEALLMAADAPLSVERLEGLLVEEGAPERKSIRTALLALQQDYAARSVQLIEVAGGWRFQVGSDYAGLLAQLWEQRPQRLSRALLETLALIVYRQPISRGEIEDVRGVAVASSIMRTLLERDWVRIVGHREVPGRPALFASTRTLLDDLGVKNLKDLPSLPEVRDLDALDAAVARLRADAAEQAAAPVEAAGDGSDPGH